MVRIYLWGKEKNGHKAAEKGDVIPRKHWGPSINTGGITSAFQSMWVTERNASSRISLFTKWHLLESSVILALLCVCKICWIICAKEITLPLFFANSSGFISRWAAGALGLTGDVFALGLLGLQGCSADHCRPSDLSGVPCIGLGFPSKDSFCCSGLLPSVRKHQIMTLKW